MPRSITAAQIAHAETAMHAAHDGSLGFPQIIGLLMGAGFEGYTVDYRANSQTFHLPSGAGHSLAMPGLPGPVAARFDAAEIARLIRWAQSGAADYSYAAFCDQAKAAGCAGYFVSFLGRRVLYFGRSAETHVEHLPT